MGHVIDKSFESWLGFIHVLPGAFSGYRWEALNCPKNKSIDKYLEYILNDKPNDDIYKANMYLAEDRIFSLYLYGSSTGNYSLKFVMDAEIKVDGPKTLLKLKLQRRRWINGAWFALNDIA